jgi:excisionase family DNA binding protein
VTRPPQNRVTRVTVTAAAEQLGVDRSTVYDWIKGGLLGCLRYPSTTGSGDGPIRIEQPEIDRFLEAHRVPAST